MLAVWVMEERHCPPPLHHPGLISSRIRLLVLPGHPVCPSCLSIPTPMARLLGAAALPFWALGSHLDSSPPLLPAMVLSAQPLSKCPQLSTTLATGAHVCLS